jgi:signal transduction histidine kinase
MVNKVRSLARTYWLEVVIVLLALGGMVEMVVRRDAPDVPTTALWFALPAVAIMVLPLFARRRFPFAAAAGYWLLAAGITFVDGRLIPFMSSVFVLGMVVAFMLGYLPDAAKARIGLAIVLAVAAIVVYNAPGHPASQLVYVPILFGICWVAGFVVRNRSEWAEAAEVRATEAERERDTAARLAVAEERSRIARELHDIVAHAVSVMVLQVGAVRHQLPDELGEDREALKRVEHAGRSALTEMRHLLDAMREDGEAAELGPQPGLASLDRLAEDVGRAGLAVHLHVDGEAVPIPRGVDISAYRIVQEGLTNALKHAHARRAEVTVSYRPDAVRIEVRDDGNGGVASNGNGHGHGLIGIRERVKLYGGEMSAGRANGGGFVLTTHLPLAPYGR